ncbi:hypothetical protein HK101_009131, partial [Irineochytrium annulatum]
NIFKAELEFWVSNHQTDEFYYTNVPDSYANPGNGVYGGGTFKELQAMVDGELAGVDWHVPVIYTGGFNPLLWRPIVHIGSSDIPSYSMDLTPFSGILSDATAPHSVTLNVTHQTPGSLWFVNANLKLWLDANSTQTTTITPPVFTQDVVEPTVVLDEDAAKDANITTSLNRRVSWRGVVAGNGGQRRITVVRSVEFANFLSYYNQTNNLSGFHNLTTLHSTLLESRTTPATSFAPSTKYTTHSTSPMTFTLDFIGLTPDFSQYIVNTTISTRRYKRDDTDSKVTREVDDVQHASGFFGTVPGLARTTQGYHGKFGGVAGCWNREVGGFNRTFVKDVVTTSC